MGKADLEKLAEKGAKSLLDLIQNETEGQGISKSHEQNALDAFKQEFLSALTEATAGYEKRIAELVDKLRPFAEIQKELCQYDYEHRFREIDVTLKVFQIIAAHAPAPAEVDDGMDYEKGQKVYDKYLKLKASPPADQDATSLATLTAVEICRVCIFSNEDKKPKSTDVALYEKSSGTNYYDEHQAIHLIRDAIMKYAVGKKLMTPPADTDASCPECGRLLTLAQECPVHNRKKVCPVCAAIPPSPPADHQATAKAIREKLSELGAINSHFQNCGKVYNAPLMDQVEDAIAAILSRHHQIADYQKVAEEILDYVNAVLMEKWPDERVVRLGGQDQTAITRILSRSACRCDKYKTALDEISNTEPGWIVHGETICASCEGMVKIATAALEAGLRRPTMPTKKQGDSGIEYVTKSWGPWRGCTKVSEGCVNCYAERAMKWHGLDPFKVVRQSDATFYAPLKKSGGWETPQRVFVCPWSDFFHEKVDSCDRHDAWRVIRDTPHTYLMVTKRPENIERYLDPFDKNRVWFIATCENQKRADERIPILIDLKARGIITNIGVSFEPALEDIDFGLLGTVPESITGGAYKLVHEYIDQIIVGCESGPRRRPCPTSRIESVVRQCREANVLCFVKQLDINGKVSTNPAEWPPILRVRQTGKEK